MNAVLSKNNTPSAAPPAEKQKRDELSVCNVVFCLLVIFIHVSAEPVTLYNKQSILYILVLSLWRLSSFVVQGFLFLSGVKLFLHYTPDGFSYKKFFFSRFKRVVIPYILAVGLFYAYFFVTNAMEITLPGFLRHLFVGDLTSHFYFVIIICQFYLLMPLWRAMAQHASPLIALPCSLILMMILKQYLPEILRVLFGIEDFRHNSRLFTSYVFYFVLGIFCGLSYERFRETLRKQKKAITIGWIVTAFINCLFLYWNSTGKYYAQWLDNFHILYSFFAILLSLLAAEKLSGTGFYREKLLPFFSRMDKVSYSVYLIHPLFIFLTDQVMRHTGISSVSLRYLLRFIVVYPLTCGVCLLWQIVRKKFSPRFLS